MSFYTEPKGARTTSDDALIYRDKYIISERRVDIEMGPTSKRTPHPQDQGRGEIYTAATLSWSMYIIKIIT